MDGTLIGTIRLLQVSFPSDDPKYSCIVVIDNPKKYRIYGSDVAAPVFKEIADKIFISDDKYFTEIKKKKKLNFHFRKLDQDTGKILFIYQIIWDYLTIQ